MNDLIMKSSYIKKINPKIIEKMNEISSGTPKEIQEFLTDLLLWQAESDEKGYSENEISEGFSKKLEEYANNTEIIKYLEKKNAS